MSDYAKSSGGYEVAQNELLNNFLVCYEGKIRGQPVERARMEDNSTKDKL